MPKTFAKIVLVNGRGDILSLRRSDSDDYRPGGHDFPGGTVESGEDPLAGVIRETMEETGIKVSTPRLVFTAPRTGPYGTGTWLLYTAFVPDDTVLYLSNEHSAFSWQPPVQVLATSDHPGHEAALRFIIEHDLLNPAVAAGVTCRSLVMNDHGELLLLRRSATDPFHAGAWDLPGGRAEPGELLIDTAARELAEEAGIFTPDLTLVFGTSNPRPHGTGSWLFYQARVPANTPVILSDEHDIHQWIPFADLPKYTDYEVLLRAHEFVGLHGLA